MFCAEINDKWPINLYIKCIQIFRIFPYATAVEVMSIFEGFDILYYLDRT